jgi:hypothetical protein
LHIADHIGGEVVVACEVAGLLVFVLESVTVVLPVAQVKVTGSVPVRVQSAKADDDDMRAAAPPSSVVDNRRKRRRLETPCSIPRINIIAPVENTTGV